MSSPVIWTGSGAKVLQSTLRNSNDVAFALISDVTQGAAPTPSSQNANFTAVAAKIYLVDTSANTVTATLPSGAANAQIVFMDAEQTWGTYSLTVTPASGQKIMGLAVNESMVCDISGAFFECVWDATNSWWVTRSNGAVNAATEIFASHDGTNLVTGSSGAVVPTTTPASFNDEYDLTSAFGTISSTDQFAIEIQQAGSGPWTSLPNNEIEYLQWDGTNFTGAGLRNTSTAIKLFRGKYPRQSGSTASTWSNTMVSGTRWRVRKTSGRSVSYPEATSTTSGLISAGTQTIGGAKTFSSGIVLGGAATQTNINDYREVYNWTPVVSNNSGTSGTWSSKVGFFYTVVGNLVHCQGYVVNGTTGNTASPVVVALPVAPYTGTRQLVRMPTYVNGAGATGLGLLQLDTDTTAVYFYIYKDMVGNTLNTGSTLDFSFNFSYKKA